MLFDRRLFIPAIIQCIALVAPFFYLRIAISQNQSGALQGEALISIIAFLAIVIDFSGSTFLAKYQSKLLKRGALSSVIIGRLVTAIILVAFSFIFFGAIENNLITDLRFEYVCMLVAVAIEPSWVYIGKGYLWFPSANSALRFCIAACMVMTGMKPALSLAISFLLTSVIAVLNIGVDKLKCARISFKLYFRIIKNFYKPTITDFITAIFSRLDVAFAVMYMSVSDALIYSIIRKLILGLNSVVFSGSKIFYLERNRNTLITLKKVLIKNLVIAYVIGVPLSVIISTYWFCIGVDDKFLISIIIMSSLMYLGFRKMIIQYSIIYVNKFFYNDMLCSIASMSSFTCLCIAFYFFDILNVVTFSASRVFADLSYIYIMTKSGIAVHAYK